MLETKINLYSSFSLHFDNNDFYKNVQSNKKTTVEQDMKFNQDDIS